MRIDQSSGTQSASERPRGSYCRTSRRRQGRDGTHGGVDRVFWFSRPEERRSWDGEGRSATSSSTAQLPVVASVEQTDKESVRERETRAASIARFALSPFVVEEFRRHRVRSTEGLLQLGVKLTADHHVVAREDRLPVQPRSLSERSANSCAHVESMPFGCTTCPPAILPTCWRRGCTPKSRRSGSDTPAVA
jgi:hypothetical protein